eukprot:TRINITY_DN14442_c0_g1_i1.p1 TRINITY_DN14442_c0_g1~~TRINITY_DN14442_c0_g1_i1.p1  ORF type:complete len:262 (-),score=71.45 TRINITY_DN14442_c0_g1_i1:29-814(-)
MTSAAFETITYSVKDGVAIICLNRPQRKNAITLAMYDEVVGALGLASKDDAVVVAMITGAGDYYSSGNDLSGFLSVEDPQGMLKTANELLTRFVDAFIVFDKPLIAAVNGPSFGIATTTLGLCDFVYAHPKATFTTPFMRLAQSPEGCSSLTFPQMMGMKANLLLMADGTITAEQAERWNFVTAILPAEGFHDEALKIATKLAKLPKQALKDCKKLMRSTQKDLLLQTNRREVELLNDRWQSEEFVEAISAFFMNKQNAKL